MRIFFTTHFVAIVPLNISFYTCIYLWLNWFAFMQGQTKFGLALFVSAARWIWDDVLLWFCSHNNDTLDMAIDFIALFVLKDRGCAPAYSIHVHWRLRPLQNLVCPTQPCFILENYSMFARSAWLEDQVLTPYQLVKKHCSESGSWELCKLT